MTEYSIKFNNNNIVKIINIDKDKRSDYDSLSESAFMALHPNLNLVFKGKDNMLCLDEKIIFINTKIVFYGNNGLCCLNNTRNSKVNLNLSIHDNSSFYLGENCSFNGRLNAISSENRVIFIGKDTMFSFGIWIRTSDVHVILDKDSKKIINKGKDIIIGQHVWVGQNVTLLKGAVIGSYTVLGFGSIVSKVTSSNAIWVGSPAKEVRQNIIWDRQSMHSFGMDDYREFEETVDIEDNGSYAPDKNIMNVSFYKEKLASSRMLTVDEKMNHYNILAETPLVVINKPSNIFSKMIGFFK